MLELIGWLERVFAGLPLPFLEVWGRFSFLVGGALALYAFCGFTFRQGGGWGWGRERQTWDTRAFLSLPLTFVLITATGYIGSSIVLVPGAQTFESLKDLVVFLCIVLLGYPALITVPFAYGLSDLIEGVPPEFLLNWLPGYFINPTCFWIAYQLIGKDPDFRKIRTWGGYLLFVPAFMILEPVLWGYICSDEFTPEISYRTITPALFFTTGITWILAPFAMLAALPLARKAGLYWAEIPGHVNERLLGRETCVWASGEGDARPESAAPRGLPIRMALLLPFIVLVLLMVGLTAFVTLYGAENHERMLAAQLQQVSSAALVSNLDDHLNASPSAAPDAREAGLSKLLRKAPLAAHGRLAVLDFSGRAIGSSAPPGDAVMQSGIEALRRRPGGLEGVGAFQTLTFEHLTAKPLSKETWLAHAALYTPPGANEPAWILLTMLPESYFLSGVRSGSSRSATIFAVALLFSLALAFALASLVTAPIRRLSRATAALAGGDLSQRVPGSRLQELGELAEAFSNMSSQLEKSFSEIQAQVEERRRRERELQESEERLKTVIGNMSEGLVIADLNGQILQWNRTALNMHGFENEAEWLRRLPEFETIFELSTEDGKVLKLEEWPLARVMRGESLRELDLRVQRPGSDWRRVFRYGGSIVNDPLGRSLALLTIGDITERTRLEEQFRQSQKMEAVGQLASGVAHDFNNLLTVINGYSQILLAAMPPDEPRRGQVDQILQAGERAAALTRQLLAFSRKQVVEPKVLNPNEVLAQTEKMLQRLIGENIELELRLARDLGRVRIDPGQLDQVLLNLAVNARDAMSRGGKLSIETRDLVLDEDYCAAHPESKPGRYVLLSMTDTGCGMPPEVKARIFEPFFTTKGVGKGTGLGLATVFGIVKQSGGQIEAYSEVDVGTCFKLYLPSVDAAPDRAAADHESDADLRGSETILLVEDEQSVREIARLVLQRYGYEVLEARNGREGLEAARQREGPIHLLLTDVVMPELGGRQLAETLQERIPSLKVLYMSGYIADAAVHHGIVEQNVAFLNKPFSPQALARKVREVLGARKGSARQGA
ncbi:MAG: response regulator [Planctomycetota bacterium]|nr:response regulator [Planctomycetota bacterium]